MWAGGKGHVEEPFHFHHMQVMLFFCKRVVCSQTSKEISMQSYAGKHACNMMGCTEDGSGEDREEL